MSQHTLSPREVAHKGGGVGKALPNAVHALGLYLEGQFSAVGSIFK